MTVNHYCRCFSATVVNFEIMKRVFQYLIIITLTGITCFTSCSKEKATGSVLIPPPAKATINFHIRDTSLSGWGEPLYLHRLILTPTANYYDSSQNIFLRPNIDTTFIYPVAGNTNNLFKVGGDPFDGIPIYMEHKFITPGSNINWEIIY